MSSADVGADIDYRWLADPLITIKCVAYRVSSDDSCDDCDAPCRRQRQEIRYGRPVVRLCTVSADRQG